MSRTTTSRSRYELNRQIVTSSQIAQRDAALLSSSWKSRQITELGKAVSRTAQVTLPRLEEIQANMIQAIPSPDLLPTASRAAMSRAVSSINALQAAHDTDALAIQEADRLNKAHSLLQVALEGAAADIARVEMNVTDWGIAQVLPELGYESVVRVAGINSIAYEARRHDEVLVLVVKEGGDVEKEHAGLNGDACVLRDDALVHELAMHGIVLEEQERVRHDDPNGGDLIAEAGREHAGSLAAGAAIVADRQYAAGPSRGKQLRTNGRSRRLSEGAAR
jgi:hypothetical protein